jgi:hypothetical protein
VIGTVDETKGTVTFAPISGSADTYGAAAPGIYGNQNVTINIHSTSFSIDSVTTPGTKVWSIGVGLRNLLAYPIGSNQGAVSPADTSGIFVFFSSLPIVTLPSGCGCSISVTNPMGSGNFTAPAQRYFWYYNRPQAKQAIASTDTTTNNPVWKFIGPKAIRAFTFVIQISSAWPAPNQTQWTSAYNGATDSFPFTQASPPWKLAGFSIGGSQSWNATGWLLSGTAAHDAYAVRNDSLADIASAIFDAQLSVSSANNGIPENFFGFFSPVVYLIGVAQDKIGFVTLNTSPSPPRWVFLGTPYTFPGANATSVHSYRLRKYSNDSAVLCVDGSRVLVATKAALAPDTVGGAQELFGTAGQSGASSARWAAASYTIGTSGTGCS